MIVQNKTNCLLCGCTSELNYAAYPGYQIPSVYEIYYCDNCNTSFSIPREESNSIYELIYKNGKRVRWYERNNEYWPYREHKQQLQYMQILLQTGLMIRN